MPFDPVRRGGVEQLLPQLGILDRLPVRRPPAVAPPAVDPAGDPVADVDAVGVELRPGTASSALRAPRSRPSAPCGCWWSAARRRTARAPCAPDAKQRAPAARAGIARHAPSVKISTSGSSLTSGDELARQLEDHALGRRASASSSVTSNRSRKASTTSRTSTSGADAPAVRPTVRGLPEPVPVDVGRALDQPRRDAHRARRPRPGAANCCCWARRSPASGRTRGAIALTAAWRLEVA